MYRGNDSVFRFSLIGIAFILVFFLLIVFSRMYTDADVGRTEALARLSQRQQDDSLPQTQQAFESARQELQSRLSEEGVNADEVIRGLLDKAKTEAELAAEKKRVQELGAQLTGLSEAKKVLTQASRTPVLDGTSAEALVSALELRARLEQEFASGQSDAKLTDSEIISRTLAALNFKRNIETLVEKELGLSLVPGQEPAWAQWLIADSQSFRSVLGGSGTSTGGGSALNGDSSLRAQVAFLRARLKTHNDNVVPPCWFDDAGRVQYLFTIGLSRPGSGRASTRSITVTVKPAWPPAREASAQEIRGVKPLLTRGQMSYDAFKNNANTIAQASGQQCRHSVQVEEDIRDGMRSEKILQELETFFHVIVLPR